MVPTPCRTLGVKGHRPVVGTWGRKDLLHVFAAVNATAQLHTEAVAYRTGLYRRTGESKTRRLQGALAEHLRQVAARYPAAEHPRVVLVIDNAPWHAGEPVAAALAENPHLELKRLPSYSPQLHRRATHNRPLDAVADLRRSIRNSLPYFQTVRSRVRSLIADCYPAPTDQTPSAGP
jgi:hypothetical protein